MININNIENKNIYNNYYKSPKIFDNSVKLEKYSNNNKLDEYMLKQAQIGKSQISFSGKTFKLNSRDLIFANYITEALKLSKAKNKKFQQSIIDFLKSNKAKSLEDFDWDDRKMFVKISQLFETLDEISNPRCSKYKRMFLEDEIVARITEGKTYTSSKIPYREYKNIIIREENEFDKLSEKIDDCFADINNNLSYKNNSYYQSADLNSGINVDTDALIANMSDSTHTAS